MIIGIGVDVVPHGKIHKLWREHSVRAREVVFSSQELSEIMPENASAARSSATGGPSLTEPQVRYLASRVAAKEATIKVLGLGVNVEYELSDIEVLGRAALTVKLSRGLSVYARTLGITTITGSASAADGYTISCIIGEDRDE
jgi:phosphopantetheine--protein transferase-like protein